MIAKRMAFRSRVGLQRSVVLAMMLAAASVMSGTAIAAPTGYVSRTEIGAMARSASLLRVPAIVQQCWVGVPFQNCSSLNPDVKFSIVSVGNTSSCTFQTTAHWGDKTPPTTKTYPGGPDGSTLATFGHPYAKYGTYTVTVKGTTTSGSCGTFGTVSAQFTYLAPGPFTVTGSLKVQPSTSQSVHQNGEVCKTATFLKDKAEGYAIAASFTTLTYTNAGYLLRHFLGGSGTPVNFPDGSKLSGQLLANPNFQALDKSVQAAIATQLKAGQTTIKLTMPPLERIGLYTPGDLHWSFGGTQGTDVTGSGNLTDGEYSFTLTYTIRDSYGFSVNDIFYHGVGQDMRYLQTNCGNPPRQGGAHWFPDSVTATVHFNLPA